MGEDRRLPMMEIEHPSSRYASVRKFAAVIIALSTSACVDTGSDEPWNVGLEAEALVALADGTQITQAELDSRVRSIGAEIASSRSALSVVATTTVNGELVDWIRPESQLPGIEPPKAPPPLWEIQGVDRTEVVSQRSEEIAAEAAKLVGDRPGGTVPSPRYSPDFIARQAKSYGDFVANIVKPVNECPLPGNCRYYGRSRQTGSFWGTTGKINVWKPNTENPPLHPMSLLQFSMAADGSDGKSETIEVGSMVNTDLFIDAWTHMFLFLTSDGYGSSSCYNMVCQGAPFNAWYQQSTTKYPGIRLTPTSVIDGVQREMHVAVYPLPGWYWIWMIDEWIGAIRGDFYEASGLLHGGTRVSWYGEVNDPDDGVASKTQMGSGRFANAGFGRAAYMSQLSTYARNADQSMGPVNPYAPTIVTATDTACYTVMSDTSNPANVVIWSGGPGWNNTTCKTD